MTLEHPAHRQVRPVTGYASVVLADNPSPMTLDGTNSWLVGAPERSERVVIDPGPDDAAHLDLLAEQGRITLILLTHHHPDHVEGVASLVARTAAPVRAADPELCRGAAALRDGELIDAAGVGLRVLTTPGHTADSICLHAADETEPAVFTGDSILGRGTTIVAHPDGHLGGYLSTLDRLSEMPPGTRALPGHGPDLPDVAEIARAYQAHRRQRLDQIRAVLADEGPQVSARRVVEIVYADVDRAVWPAAEATVRAQLAHLQELGER